MLDFNELADKDLKAVDDEDDQIYTVPVPAKKKPAVLLGAKVSKLATAVKPQPPSINRRMQVLVLHGKQSNENLVGFQIANLKGALGKDVDIKILEGDVIWKYREGVDNHDADPMSISLSKGKDFKVWFNHTTDDKRERVDFFKQMDPSVKFTYEGYDKAVDKVLKYIEEEPVDVIVSVFEGSLVVHLMIAKLLKEGKEIPWRQSIFFSPLSIRDDSLTAPFSKGPIAHSAVMVFGKTDEYYYYQRTAAGRIPSEEYYDDTTVLLHDDGHQLPTGQPRAKEIYERIVAGAKYQCGLDKTVPKKVLKPPKPGSMVLKNLEDMSLRKLRVLCFCGGHSCIPVIKFQTNTLKMALGKDKAEFTYIEGTKDWEWYTGEPTVSEMEERIAGGKQLKNWYMDQCHEKEKTDRLNKDKQFDPDTWVEYKEIPEVLDHWYKWICENGPFDVAVGFSMGGIFLHMLLAHFRKMHQPGGIEKYPQRWQHAMDTSDVMPFRLTCFFNAMHIRDKRYFDMVEKPLDHPTVHVFGKADEYYDYARDGFGNKPQEEYYVNPLVLTHEESHQFPTVQPRAKQIYDKVVAEIWRTCGGKPIS